MAPGVDQALPRILSVFARKLRWRVPEQRDVDHDTSFINSASTWRRNYPSARDRLISVKKAFKADVAANLVVELTQAEAVARFGARLQIATHGLGLLQRIRVVCRDENQGALGSGADSSVPGRTLVPRPL